MQTKSFAIPQNKDIEIFNRRLVKERRNRFAKHLRQYNFLHNWVGEQIADRLDDIKREFPSTLLMSARCDDAITDKIVESGKITSVLSMDLSSKMVSAFSGKAFVADEELLPIKENSLDAAVSILNLHTINDLPGALIQINRALKPDGVFIGSMFGGETLFELREALNHAEMKLKGGMSPRVAPFADMQQMASLMQRGGYALPVVDSEIIKISYNSMFDLMKDIRFMAEANSISARAKTLTSRSIMMEAAQYYDENFAEGNGKVYASFEVIFLIGWAPHESQQQPLRPGSAQNSLASALNTKEINTGVSTGVIIKDQ